MYDIPCMRFVNSKCYEGDNTEELMDFSLLKRLSGYTQSR